MARAKRATKKPASNNPTNIIVVTKKEDGISEESMINYGMIFVGIVISILLSGATSTMGALSKNNWQAGGLSYDVIWASFTKTLPVSLSALFIMFGWLRGWMDDFMVGVLYAFGVLLVFTLLLQPNGWDVVKVAWEKKPSGLFGFPVSLVMQYLLMYWWKPFVAGVISGSFAGWAAFLKTRKFFE
jgi:hypothetical protein